MMDNELAYHFRKRSEKYLNLLVHLKGMKNEVVDLSSKNMLTNEKCLHINRRL
jgi:hypothetical protein